MAAVDYNPANPEVPPELRGNGLTKRIIRQKIYRPPNHKEEWRVFVIVGREGWGKSLTAAKILAAADPSFNVGRVHFRALDFLEQVHGGEVTAGNSVMIDESGVSLGRRSWYEQDQIQINKLLQTARDDCLIIGLTLPRLEELDSQTIGRLHHYLEVVGIDKDNHTTLKFMNLDPTRDGSNEIYKKYPRMRVDGIVRRVTRIGITPPDDEEFVRGYREKKARFKTNLYAEIIDDLREGSEEFEDVSPTDIVEVIKGADSLGDYLSFHGGHKQWYISKELLRDDFDLSHSDAKTVKQLLEKDPEVDPDAAAQREGRG